MSEKIKNFRLEFRLDGKLVGVFHSANCTLSHQIVYDALYNALEVGIDDDLTLEAGKNKKVAALDTDAAALIYDLLGDEEDDFVIDSALFKSIDGVLRIFDEFYDHENCKLAGEVWACCVLDSEDDWPAKVADIKDHLTLYGEPL